VEVKVRFVTGSLIEIIARKPDRKRATYRMIVNARTDEVVMANMPADTETWRAMINAAAQHVNTYLTTPSGKKWRESW
jgi:hypothetical protein